MIFTPSPEDFEVEEVPLAPPAGAGAHLWVEVEKRGISTPEAIRRIAARLDRSAADIGYAGLKDAHARTTQWLSIEGATESDLARAGDEALRVQRSARHPGKLALGALAGNRFRVVLRETPAGWAEARDRLERLVSFGVPNFFGAQRFGIRGLGARIGKAILLCEARLALDWLLGCPRAVEGGRLRAARARYESGDLAGALRGFPESFVPERRALEALARGAPPAAALADVPWRAREMYLSAYQAELFNRLLEERVPGRGFAALEPGDIAIVHASGEEIDVASPEAERERVASLEVSPAGPLFGHEVRRASGAPGEREAALLRAEGIDFETWRRPAGLALRGARRPYRFAVRDVSVEGQAPGPITLRFFLGPGCYATTLVEQLGVEVKAARAPAEPGR